MKYIISLLIAGFLFGGCLQVRDETVTYKDLKRANGPLEMFMKDSTILTLNTYYLENDTLFGNGYAAKNNDTTEFNGKVDFNKVNYISYNYHNGLSDVVMIAATTIILAAVIVNGGNNPMNANVTFETGSSCPFLYSFANNNWNLEGELFGTGLGKGLETSSTVLLKQLPYEKISSIKISNERPETHYFNQVEITGIEHSLNTTAYRTIKGNYIEAADAVSPVSAYYNKKNVLNELLGKDEHYWKSDLSSKNYVDVITAEFANENHNDSITIMLESMNTSFITSGYYKLSEYIGKNKLQFFNSLDTDQELISELKKFRDMSSLKVEVWNGNSWECQGIIAPEANAAQFTSAVTLKAYTDSRNKIKIRLSSLSDVWKIDKLSASYNYKQITRVIKLNPFCLGADNEMISVDDDKYFTLISGKSFEMKFNQCMAQKGKVITYAVTAKGFLHEWLPETKENFITSLIPEKERIPIIKSMLNNPRQLLPILYNDWKKRIQVL